MRSTCTVLPILNLALAGGGWSTTDPSHFTQVPAGWICRQHYLIFPSNISLFHFGTKTHASHFFFTAIWTFKSRRKAVLFFKYDCAVKTLICLIIFSGCRLKNPFCCWNYKNEKYIETAVQIWLDEAEKTYTTLELMTYLIYDKIEIHMS
jgi:hypothetical protein